MDFARKQLEKYGWKDGSGLGKACQGMAVALKPHLKSGKEGMGFDLGNDLTDPWWTKAYSDSLNRIRVSEDGGVGVGVGVSIRQDEEEGDGDINVDKDDQFGRERKMYLTGVEERPMEKMRRRMMKANFTSFSKGGTLLTNGELVSKSKGNEEEDAESKNLIKVLSDEELLKACGGRTAHKAARFGLKLNGKLARIAAQESNLFCEPYNHLSKKSSADSSLEVGSTCSSNSEDIDTSSSLKKKNRKRNHVMEEDVTEMEEAFDESDTLIRIPSKKKKKNKEKRELHNNSICDNNYMVLDIMTSLDNDVPKVKSRKSKKRLVPEIIEDSNLTVIVHNELDTVEGKRKLKTKLRTKQR